MDLNLLLGMQCWQMVTMIMRQSGDPDRRMDKPPPLAQDAVVLLIFKETF